MGQTAWDAKEGVFLENDRNRVMREGERDEDGFRGERRIRGVLLLENGALRLYVGKLVVRDKAIAKG